MSSGVGVSLIRATRRTASIAAALLLGLLPGMVAMPEAATYSSAALDSVLQAHVHHEHVGYGALARDLGPLRRYLQVTIDARPDDWPRADQIAFWVNVYNARVLDGVVRHPGIKSVLDVHVTPGRPAPAFFHETFVAAGRTLSLNAIERDILRARFHEPRIHFVLNCASTSCPPLPEHPLTAALLDQDLEQATARFLSDSERNHIDPAHQLGLSAIFDWYGPDFRATDGTVQKFIERHWPGKMHFAASLPIRFLPYEWSLNGSR